MKYFVYILQSQVDGTLYKGYSNDYLRRLAEHNAGLSAYTSRKMPWKLIYVEECESKTAAIKREKQLKRANGQYINWLLTQESNIIRK